MEPLDLTEFPTISKSEWHDLATAQLKGASPGDQLGWVSEGINLAPYYDASDLEDTGYLTDFFQDVSIQWKLYERIEVSDEAKANEEALQALSGGCDGVIFSLSSNPSFDSLLNGIFTDICDISIWAGGANTNVKEDLPAGVRGFTILKDYSDTYCPPRQYESQIAFITECIKNLGDRNHIFRYASSDFFVEVASLRALRFLIKDALSKDPFNIHIHTEVPEHGNTEYQWFLNSTAGMASIIGGSGSICFKTAIGNSRISRNVGNLIREECGIDTYTDQCGGSYFVESLTHNIIKACKNSLK
ncbi:MAG: methylmalonyl-CoA mutase family protein [Bacteroidota bacterium]